MVVGYGEDCEKVATEGTCHGGEEEKELEEFLHEEGGWIVRSLGSSVKDARHGEYGSTTGLKRPRSWYLSRCLFLPKSKT